MQGFTVHLLLITAILRHVSVAKETTVVSDAGTFMGVKQKVGAAGTLTVVKYLGIPYAEPPVGEGRFRKPVAKNRIATLYDATFFRPSCRQLSYQGRDRLGLPQLQSEDCLYLNVYVPSGSTRGQHAVMVWIHGGGFKYGFADAYAGDTLCVLGDVIVVTINYRLAVLGFGSFEDPSAPGNYGLWDQQMAIQWVHDNIASFGGDPGRVTLFGESAGAASVIYQSLYPGNRGLFQRAIAQSGSPLCPWAFNNKPALSMKMFAEAAGCATNDVRDCVTCLQAKSDSEIMTTLQTLVDGNMLTLTNEFVPGVDGEFVTAEPKALLTPDSQSDAREFFNSVDFIGGVNNAEGFLFIAPEVGIEDPEHFTMSRDILETELLPWTLLQHTAMEIPEQLQPFLSSEYFNWSDADNELYLRKGFQQMISDITFIVPTLLTLQARGSGRGHSFLYHLDVNPTVSLFPVPSWGSGANHVDDVLYVFGFDERMLKYCPAFVNKPETPAWELGLARSIMAAWANFAKSGDPNLPDDLGVHWPGYDAVGQQYLNLEESMAGSSAGRGLYGRTFNFWSRLFPLLPTLSQDGDSVCYKTGSCSSP